tara:strand:- start:435 stop:1355 length:921 start_codon:yes stop_codon:yes gene_type:complete
MNIALIGRTNILLETAKLIIDSSHEITLIATSKPESFYNTSDNEFYKLAEQLGAEYIYGSLNSDQAINSISNSKANIALSINWPTLINSEIIDLFPLGIVNAHCGDLPRYRGNACPNWAILNNEKNIAVSLHMMEANSLDSGSIYKKKRFALTSETYISEVYDWLNNQVPILFLELLNELESSTIKAVPQSTDPSDWLRCYPRRPEDSKINWNNDSEYIFRLIRASSKPFSGAYCFLESKYKFIIWKATIFEHEGGFLSVPGQILFWLEKGPVISCLNSCIYVTEFSLEREEESLKILKRLRSRLY